MRWLVSRNWIPAFSTNTSIGVWPSSFLTSSANCVTLSSEARSSGSTWAPGTSRPEPLAPAITRVLGCSARSFAAYAPSPAVAPVITTVNSVTTSSREV
ncbi:Uncharacterised protein [Mycobacteroides abscessus subsp. abscessus]|nr:Uncharacterised protein [Mycobacteroides abscessus subsp. abscessus]